VGVRLEKVGAGVQMMETKLLYISEMILGGAVSISPDLTPIGSTVPQTQRMRHLEYNSLGHRLNLAHSGP
jgi:hypothetical protein